jgi:hypothetical protein
MANISEYKRRHKPDISEKSKTKQGYYLPINTHKVVGGDIICRSSWEFKLARWCDLSDNVIRWGCEVVSIQYADPGGVDLEMCRKYNINPLDPSVWPIKNYYIDFYIEFVDVNYDGNPENIRKVLVEVKPLYQTYPPKMLDDNAKLKDKNKFNKDTKTFLTNDAKWKTATKYAELNGVEFSVWTENTLKKLGVL